MPKRDVHRNCISAEEASAMWRAIKKVGHPTEDDWLRVLDDYLRLTHRVEELEDHKDDWKIWLEGFKEGFLVRDKKERSKKNAKK